MFPNLAKRYPMTYGNKKLFLVACDASICLCVNHIAILIFATLTLHFVYFHNQPFVVEITGDQLGLLFGVNLLWTVDNLKKDDWHQSLFSSNQNFHSLSFLYSMIQLNCIIWWGHCSKSNKDNSILKKTYEKWLLGIFWKTISQDFLPNFDTFYTKQT